MKSRISDFRLTLQAFMFRVSDLAGYVRFFSCLCASHVAVNAEGREL